MTFPGWAFDQVSHLLPNNEECDSDREYPTLTYILEDEQGLTRRFDLESERYVSIEEGRKGRKNCSSVISELNIK